jgi:hypothetical protein
LTFDDEGLTLKPIVGDQITILFHEVKEISRGKKLVVFKATGQNLVVDLDKFPLKEKVIFYSYTRHWPFMRHSKAESKAVVVSKELRRSKADVDDFVEIEMNTSFGSRILPLSWQPCTSVLKAGQNRAKSEHFYYHSAPS